MLTLITYFQKVWIQLKDKHDEVKKKKKESWFFFSLKFLLLKYRKKSLSPNNKASQQDTIYKFRTSVKQCSLVVLCINERANQHIKI